MLQDQQTCGAQSRSMTDKRVRRGSASKQVADVAESRRVREGERKDEREEQHNSIPACREDSRG